MSWGDDTDKILSDGLQDYSVTVKNSTATFTEFSVYSKESLSTIETATVNIFPKTGAFKKEIEGRIIESTHLMFFPSTSSVSVSDWVYELGETDYHEVMAVKDYEGHKQVYTHKVEGR